MKKLPAVLLFAAAAFAVACNNSNAKDAASTGTSAGVSGSGSDYYYEMTAVGGGKGFNMNMTTRVYCSSAGKVRMEMLVGVEHWYNNFQKKNGGGLFTPEVNEKLQQMGATGFY